MWRNECLKMAGGLSSSLRESMNKAEDEQCNLCQNWCTLTIQTVEHYQAHSASWKLCQDELGVIVSPL